MNSVTGICANNQNYQNLKNARQYNNSNFEKKYNNISFQAKTIKPNLITMSPIKGIFIGFAAALGLTKFVKHEAQTEYKTSQISKTSFKGEMLLKPIVNLENAGKTITTDETYSTNTDQYDNQGRVIMHAIKTNHGITEYHTEYNSKGQVKREFTLYGDLPSKEMRLTSDCEYDYSNDGFITCIIKKENDSQW